MKIEVAAAMLLKLTGGLFLSVYADLASLHRARSLFTDHLARDLLCPARLGFSTLSAFEARYAPLRFFEATASGQIMNRVLQDVASVDMYVPNSLLDMATKTIDHRSAFACLLLCTMGACHGPLPSYHVLLYI